MKRLTLACDYLKKFAVKVSERCHVSVLGPADEAVAKIQDFYRKVIYLKAERIEVLTEVKNKIEQYLAINEGFRTVSIQFDVN